MNVKSEGPFANKPFHIRTRYLDDTVNLVAGVYSENGNKALLLMDPNGQLLARATVNLTMPLGTNEIAVKSYAENEGMWQALAKIRFIEAVPLRKIQSGHVSFPIAQLTPEAALMWGSKGAVDLQYQAVMSELLKALEADCFDSAAKLGRAVSALEGLEKAIGREAMLKGRRLFFKAFGAAYQASHSAYVEKMKRDMAGVDDLNAALEKMRGEEAGK